ncbi:hypothetical protein AJ80_03599 [Polytolypa hystricis UAMH7299]|uniref:Uncharacterized protein n=1 Tax=Polytolypa hystricis (strain UAMH7299) TaxID=1447883 RepID=A0A2B7YH27_POLH7|nr:hypothetical protein AJ80_03599 [Polytolypa hystricis UAMH7299]
MALYRRLSPARSDGERDKIHKPPAVKQPKISYWRRVRYHCGMPTTPSSALATVPSPGRSGCASRACDIFTTRRSTSTLTWCQPESPSSATASSTCTSAPDTQIGVLGLLTGIVVVSPRFQSARWRTLPLSNFVATGLSAFAPIIQAVTLFPYAQLTQQAGLGYYLVEGLALITGVIFYATHFPESWTPEKFDIWGASHQIFRIFVVLSAAIHFWCILSVFDWIYKNPRCPI